MKKLIKDTWKTMLVLLLGAILFLMLPYVLTLNSNSIIIVILNSLAIAFITAFVLGLTIELAVRKRLAKDVFELAFGFGLDDDIKNELRWVYGIDRLAINASFNYTIKRLRNVSGKVEMREEVKLIIKNIYYKSIEVNPHVGIQEWFHPEGSSKIESLRYYTKNAGVKDIEGREMNDKGFILRTKKELVKLAKDETVTITWITREIKYISDLTNVSLGTAILNPEVKVNITRDIFYKVDFQTREQGDIIEIAPNHYQFSGLLLPNQAIRLRWWEKGSVIANSN